MKRTAIRALVFIPLALLGLTLISQGGVAPMAAGGLVLLFLRGAVDWLMAVRLSPPALSEPARHILTCVDNLPNATEADRAERRALLPLVIAAMEGS